MLERAVADNLRSSRVAWESWLESGSREDISTKASKVETPVLIVGGERDEAITKELLEREIVRRIRKARLIVVPHAAHLLPLEVPATIAKVIRRVAVRVLLQELYLSLNLQ